MRGFLDRIYGYFSRKREQEPPESERRREFARLTGMPVKNVGYYEQALRHRSMLRAPGVEGGPSNERLEFLGDAILSVVVSRHLYERYPAEDEGFLTRLRAKLVNGAVLSEFAQSIDLGKHILMSENTQSARGRENESILADAFEAIIGALYLDLGYDAAETFVKKHVLDAVDLEELVERRDNFKSTLLEFAQARGWPQPTYRIVSEEGPGHDRVFTVEVLIGSEIQGSGAAKNKKKAEQKAARMALSKLISEHKEAESAAGDE